MFDSNRLVINAFVDKLQKDYLELFRNDEPEFSGLISFVGKMALEKLANCDAAYHDLHHTILVTDVAKEILKGKYILEHTVTPSDWLNFTVSALFHDIGYIKGICPGDKDGLYQVNDEGEVISLPVGCTDASLTQYHVERSKIYVKSRFQHFEQFDVKAICEMIERTRFPVPENKMYYLTSDMPGLLRAADLIGQFGDLLYVKKISSLFVEFEETGIAIEMGYSSGADLRQKYPEFFWNNISHLLADAVKYLRVTPSGMKCLSNLFTNIYMEDNFLNLSELERLIGEKFPMIKDLSHYFAEVKY